MNRPEPSKLFSQLSQISPPSNSSKSNDHRNISSACYQPLRRDVSHRVGPLMRSNVEDDANDTSTDDDGETTEDSTDNRLDSKPKPGKLDLRQFDNISTAIGKLNVTPLSSACPTPAIGSLTTTNVNKPITFVSKSANSASKPILDTNLNAPTSSKRRSNNLRQNHGRAVAPPKLPTSHLYNPIHRSGNELSSHSRRNQHNDGESAIDLSQSPIAQRVLRHSKDHKGEFRTRFDKKLCLFPHDSRTNIEQTPVSEIHSPYASDVEPHLPGSARLQNLFKGPHNEKTTFARYSSMDSCELINSRGETIRQLNEILAKKPPGQPGPIRHGLNKGSSNDQLTDDPKQTSSSKKDDKKDRKKLRSNEKLEKRKFKEEERLRRQEEEKQRRQEKKLASKKSKSGSLSANSIGEDGIPLFIKRCIEFIESEGLEAEGIYRVPGNRAHVDAFVQKFKDNPGMSILESDIPVNAVATALKDFLSKKWGPIIPPNLMRELTELKFIPDRRQRIEAVKELTRKLPLANYNLLKYVCSHFVKVALNNMLNSMDSKNLAICWWPTLLPLHFDDMIMFEQMRPHLEESIQTMIDHYGFIFDDEHHLSTLT